LKLAPAFVFSLSRDMATPVALRASPILRQTQPQIPEGEANAH